MWLARLYYERRNVYGMIPNLWLILGVVVLCALSALGGAKIESDHRDAQLLTQARADADAYKQGAARLRASADGTSQKFNAEKEARERDKRNFAEQLRRARQQGFVLATCDPAPSPQPAVSGVVAAGPDGQTPSPDTAVLPRLRLTLSFVGLWNSALAIGGAASGNSGATDGRVPAADSPAVHPK